MKILLDTHIFLWTVVEPDKLSPAQVRKIQSPANQIFLSSISVAEMMIKNSLGKLDIPFDPVQEAETCGFEVTDYRAAEALLLKELPFHHRDPFDRMLISQSLLRNLAIMTEDQKFHPYGCKLVGRK